MAKNPMNEVMGHIRRMVLLNDGGGQTDGKLLSCFIEDRDGAAFEALVRRHGIMVMGVCTRILRHRQDAEDAFQATFFVLVRKAKTVVPREMVGNWLYGVAQQTAIRVRAVNARRRSREKQVSVMPDPAAATPASPNDLLPVLDQELSRLPAKYRAPIVLCDLEGRTRKEVARQLGWPEGSVSSRLSRGRALLAKRLAKHGLVFSAEALAILITQNAASACVPPALVSATVKAAALMAAGQTAVTGLVSAQVAALTKGVLTSMLLTKLKTAGLVTILVGALGIGAGATFLSGQTPGNEPQTIGQGNGNPNPGLPPRETQLPKEEKKTAPQRDPLRSELEIVDKEISRMRDKLEFLHEKNAQLLAMIESLQKDSKSKPVPTTVKTEIRIFQLKNLQANEVAETILFLFDRATLNEETVPVENNMIGFGGPPGPGGLGIGGQLGGLGGFQGGNPGQFQGMQGGFGGLAGGGGMIGAGAPPPPHQAQGAGPILYRLRIATIDRTNTIIVRGNPDDLRLVEGLITSLDQLPIPKDAPPPQPRRNRDAGAV